MKTPALLTPAPAIDVAETALPPTVQLRPPPPAEAPVEPTLPTRIGEKLKAIGSDRALQKALTWRGVAAIDTLTLAYLTTGNMGAAASIMGVEQVTKVGQFWLHEKLWDKFAPEAAAAPAKDEAPAPKTLLSRLKKLLTDRSLLKAMTWRLWGSADTMLIALMVTGKVSSAASIAGAELVTKIGLYIAHDKVWAHFSPGGVKGAPLGATPEESPSPGPAPPAAAAQPG